VDRRGVAGRVYRCLGLVVLLWLALASAAARDRGQVRAFRAEHPCPSTGQHRGACPGWHVDHITALCAGGEDHPRNMQWITVEDHRFKTLIDVRECRRQAAKKLPTL
jgi:hypothetical protein